MQSSAATMRPSRFRNASARPTKRRFGTAVSEARRSASAIAFSGRVGVERAQRDERRRRRAAEAGVAVDEQRRLAVPAAHELDELADMLFGRRRGALLHLDDVVHVELQVPLDGKAGRRGGNEIGVDGADEMAGAGVLDDLRNVPQCTNVDGGGRSNLHDRSFSCCFVRVRSASEP